MERLIIRITPACAGKRYHGGTPRKTSKDHPRVCGEKREASIVIPSGIGSPPRVRGKERAEGDCRINRRITPACAGKRLKKAHKIKDFDPVPI